MWISFRASEEVGLCPNGSQADCWVCRGGQASRLPDAKLSPKPRFMQTTSYLLLLGHPNTLPILMVKPLRSFSWCRLSM